MPLEEAMARAPWRLAGQGELIPSRPGAEGLNKGSPKSICFCFCAELLPPSVPTQKLAIQAAPLLITAKNVRRKVAAESVAALYTDITRQREALPSHGNAFFNWYFF